MKADIKSVNFAWNMLFESDSFAVYRVSCTLETHEGQISNASHVFDISKIERPSNLNRAELKAYEYAAEQIGLEIDK
jgi:hypothetical protein